MASELESDLQLTVEWDQKWPVDFNTGKIQLVSFNQSNNTDDIDVKMDRSILEEKSSLKMMELTFFSKLDWGSYIIPIAKTASKKAGDLIHSTKFLSPLVALYLYKSTIVQSLPGGACNCTCICQHMPESIYGHENLYVEICVTNIASYVRKLSSQ